VIFPDTTDQWLTEIGPSSEVVVSSRARLARNLPDLPFAPRANEEQRNQVAALIGEAIGRNPDLAPFQCYELSSIQSQERIFLRESHLISNEMEKGGVGRLVFLSRQMDTSIMVNEEDHLRLSTLCSGFRAEEAFKRLLRIEQALENELNLAYSREFGYLTACPTNTGTGLRLSVMLHLPALVMTEQVEKALQQVGHYGLVVRGAYGEHTDHHGELFQVSNEFTLGKTEDDILEIINREVRKVIDLEVMARQQLLREAREKLEDAVCRAVGLLSMARSINSMEALSLLSRTRLGVGQKWGVRMSHPELSRLFVEIQPAHLQCRTAIGLSANDRDLARAALLRRTFNNN